MSFTVNLLGLDENVVFATEFHTGRNRRLSRARLPALAGMATGM